MIDGIMKNWKKRGTGEGDRNLVKSPKCDPFNPEAGNGLDVGEGSGEKRKGR